MTTQKPKAIAEAQVRALIESWVKAARSKDLDTIMSLYTPDVVAYDAVLALEFKGRDAYRKHWQVCMEMCPGEMTYEAGDLGVAVSDDVAFCHYLARCGGTDDKGEEKSGWMRATVCCRKVDGKWLIAHEHYSAPFDPQSGNALFELTP